VLCPAGAFSIYWAVAGRPELAGDLATRWAYLQDTFNSNRVGTGLYVVTEPGNICYYMHRIRMPTRSRLERLSEAQRLALQGIHLSGGCVVLYVPVHL
jgi:hypothetical protein